MMKTAISELPTPPNGTHFSQAESHFILFHYDYDYPRNEENANGEDKANKATKEGHQGDDKAPDERQPKVSQVNRFDGQADWARKRTGRLSFEEMAAFIAYVREKVEIPGMTASERDDNAEMVRLTHPPGGLDVAMEYHRLKAFYSHAHDQLAGAIQAEERSKSLERQLRNLTLKENDAPNKGKKENIKEVRE